MLWFPDPYPLPNRPSQAGPLTAFPTAANGQQIRLREELYLLLRGLNGDPAIGKWTILRHFDKTRHSRFWDETRHEAIGGPAWEYTDYLGLAFRVRYTTGRSIRDADVPVPPGRIVMPTDLWFFEWDVLPEGQKIQEDDEIFELNYQKAKRPVVQESMYADRFRIILPEPHFGEDNGRLEYWGATAIRELSRN